jgi:hypothetical protein
MAVHTWFYTTTFDIGELNIPEIGNMIECVKLYAVNDDYISLYNELYNENKESLTDEDVYALYCEMHESKLLYSTITNKFYIKVDYHDIFRCAYDDIELLSLDQTLEYIKTHDCSFHISKELAIKKINEFWDKYPNGLIKFG